MRTALALLRPTVPPPSHPRDLTADTGPRGFVFENLFQAVWDQRILRGGTATKLPEWMQLAWEVHRRRDEYDVIVTWGERLSFSLMAIDRLTGPGKPHIAFISQFSKPNVDWPMRLLGRQLHAGFVSSSVQRDYGLRAGYISPDRLFLVRFPVDSHFYRPQPGAEDLICAVGAEMRDYATLFAALDGTSVPCHVAADLVRIPGRFRIIKDRRVRVEEFKVRPNPLITVGRKKLTELRELYARSRFVVIPLLPSQSDNGVTVILEAMAMGKAVICSATKGQVDVIEHGVNGLLVPVGDPDALRAAIISLWNDPARAREMGARGRSHIERYHAIERFSANISTAIQTVMSGGQAPSQAWWDSETLPPGVRLHT